VGLENGDWVGSLAQKFFQAQRFSLVTKNRMRGGSQKGGQMRVHERKHR
jgi:hypothetical protein